VKKHAQAIDVGPGVDVKRIELGLLGTHVLKRADDCPETGRQRPFRQLLSERLGHAEVDDLGNRLAVIGSDEDIARLQIAVDNSLLMGMLDSLADRYEQLQPLPWG